MRYGFIGLGHLGGHLAVSLVKGGFGVTVNDLDRKAAERHLALGASWADSPAAVARASDAVITCLPSPAASRAVVAGPKGVLESHPSQPSRRPQNPVRPLSGTRGRA